MRVVTFSLRQLAIVGLVAALGCGRGQQRAEVTPAPATPTATVEAFLVAANANDLDRMAALWGDEDGPSNATNKIPLEERQQRLAIMQRVLRNDQRRVMVTDSTNPLRPIVTADLTQGTRRFSIPFVCITSRAGGWLIREVSLEPGMQRQQPNR